MIHASIRFGVVFVRIFARVEGFQLGFAKPSRHVIGDGGDDIDETTWRVHQLTICVTSDPVSL